ncbi:DUF2007 domain-containing protein [Aurantibacter crassamenti]|uniref:putative signal transducing protein n=1 Tax=Aurantibacter crassamenti TaxID=1837375 RepID=UPI001939EED2|nr:DUF2007 domain-containing protein [Aurantibacter crassamenti]MBM1107904.1 DUF2007 domain-containing protein [Aurantibacter crassamenti]
MHSNYSKVFSGNQFIVKKIVDELKKIGIEPVLKDESKSARMAGFASSMNGDVDIYVHNDEFKKAQKAISEIS